MKQDQSYFRQVFYLREDNFGLNCKKNITFKISYKIVALFTENYPSKDSISYFLNANQIIIGKYTAYLYQNRVRARAGLPEESSNHIIR